MVMVENGIRPQRIVIAGGGARSKLWIQIVADLFGLPVEKVLVDEQSAYGAGILAGAGIGMFDIIEGAEKWKKRSVSIEPNMNAHSQYQEHLSLFRELNRATSLLS